MENTGLLEQALIYLAAGVIAVPIFKRLGLGSVLGYLVAGVAIGPWGIGLIAGMGFAMSSTAIGLQTLTEKNLLPTPGGQASFAVLLFQDLSVVPLLVLLAFLAGEKSSFSMLGMLEAVGMIALVILAGR